MLGLDPKLKHDFIVTPLGHVRALLELWSERGSRAVNEPSVRDTGLDGRGLPTTWLAAALCATMGEGFAPPLERILVLPTALQPTKPGDVDASLLRALGRIKAGGVVDALEAVEDAWRFTRAPELAELISALESKIPSTAIEVPKKKSELEERWLAAVRPETHVEVLFNAPWPTQWRDAQRRLNALYTLPRSPRLAAGALLLARRDPRPYTAQAAQVFWQGLAWFIAEQGDVRQHAALLEFEQGLAKFIRRTETPASDALAALKPTPLTPVTRKHVEALAALVGPAPKRAATTVIDTPNTAEARQVWADQLLDAGDPRGEFIALQQALAAGHGTDVAEKKLRTLLNKHVKTWAPPALHRDTAVFRAGVAVEGHLVFRSDRELESLIDAKSLAPLERVLVDHTFAIGRVRAETKARFIARQALGALRSAMTTAEVANELCDCPPSELTHLQVLDDSPVQLDGAGLPKLRRLDVVRPKSTWPKQPWFRQLEQLGVGSMDLVFGLRDEADYPKTLVYWSPRGHYLHRDAKVVARWELALHRDVDGWSLSLNPLPGATADGAARLLRETPNASGGKTVSVPKAAVTPELIKQAKKRKLEVVARDESLWALGVSVDSLRG